MDPHQPKTLRECLVPAALIILVAGGNAWALFAARPEQLSEPAATVCRAVPLGRMQNRACLGSEPKVVIWGDSMANAWIPMVQELGTKLQLPATNLARDGCPPLSGANLTLRWPQEAVDCAAWNAQSVEYLRTHGADTLVIAARWRNFMQPGLDNGAAAAIARSVAQASPHVRRILVIAPTPELVATPDKCEQLGVDCTVARSDFEADSRAARAALQALTVNPKVQLVEPSDWLCEGARCPAFREGVPLYADQAHVSAFTAQEFGSLVAGKL